MVAPAFTEQAHQYKTLRKTKPSLRASGFSLASHDSSPQITPNTNRTLAVGTNAPITVTVELRLITIFSTSIAGMTGA